MSLASSPARPVLQLFPLATLWRKMADGSLPKPMKLDLYTTAWRVEVVRAWMDCMEASARADADGGVKK